MRHYDYYADAPDEAIANFIESSRLGRLVTVERDAMPHIGLYPFVQTVSPAAAPRPTVSPAAAPRPTAEGFELHLHRDDEQIADLRERPRCVLEFDDVLSTIPSHWIHPENAVFATAYHKTVAFECTASLVDAPDEVARQQNRIMARYQPEGGYRAVGADDAMYAGLLNMLAQFASPDRRRR
jgi:hypothetical protein